MFLLFLLSEGFLSDLLLLMIISGSIHVAANGNILFFLWLSDVSLCVCVPACSVAKLSWTLCDTMNCSLPGSSVPGISQAIRLEWVAISYPLGSS